MAPLALAALAYARTLRGEFQLDDFPSFAGNPSVRDLGAWSVARFTSELAHGGRPLTGLSFAWNHALGGLDPRPFHATNLAIHLAAVVLAFLFTREVARLAGIARQGPLALAVAGVFALHPLQSEAVSYVAQRSESLASALYLGALMLLLAAARRGRTAPGVAGYLAALATFTLALAAKPVAVTMPAAWLLLVLAVPGPEARRALPRPAVLVAMAAPFAALGGLLAAGTLRALEGQATAGLSVEGIPPWSYFLTQWRAVATYLRLVAWPSGQSVDWFFPISRSPAEPATAASGLLLGALAAGAMGLLWWARRPPAAPVGGATPGAEPAAAAARVAGFGVLWFLLVLAPTSSVVPLADALAEHRTYLASWGILAAAAAGADLLIGRLAPGRRGAAGALLVAAAWGALALALHRRNAAWETRLALWSDAVAQAPRSGRAHMSLGFALRERGDLEGALREYRVALGLLRPGSTLETQLLRNLGAALLHAGRVAEAAAVLGPAAERPSADAALHANLAIALARGGDRDGAERSARRSLELDPRQGEALQVLGGTALERGDAAAAARWLEEAVRVDPEAPGRRLNLGLALEAAGRRGEACTAWSAALGLRPDAALRTRLVERMAAARCPPPPGLPPSGSR